MCFWIFGEKTLHSNVRQISKRNCRLADKYAVHIACWHKCSWVQETMSIMATVIVITASSATSAKLPEETDMKWSLGLEEACLKMLVGQ